jgi:hypothetical protein
MPYQLLNLTVGLLRFLSPTGALFRMECAMEAAATGVSCTIRRPDLSSTWLPMASDRVTAKQAAALDGKVGGGGVPVVERSQRFTSFIKVARLRGGGRGLNGPSAAGEPPTVRPHTISDWRIP